MLTGCAIGYLKSDGNAVGSVEERRVARLNCAGAGCVFEIYVTVMWSNEALCKWKITR